MNAVEAAAEILAAWNDFVPTPKPRITFPPPIDDVRAVYAQLAAEACPPGFTVEVVIYVDAAEKRTGVGPSYRLTANVTREGETDLPTGFRAEAAGCSASVPWSAFYAAPAKPRDDATPLWKKRLSL